ncbi:hypothetical protein BG006_002154 [Podila minutissima]|uniref:Uncharacterized protein n=1 Tax=Podila minutissima TaxID=64525 RepID=A0A9P5ST22_9FUNG|nr:hypothetical protein BG006_002154 [Podila minutissima]
MHHSEAIPSFIHLGNTSKLRKRHHNNGNNNNNNNNTSVDSAHSPRLTATSFATTSTTTHANKPQSSIDEAAYILKHVSIRDRHLPHKRRGRPISRVRGKHGSGKTFNPYRYRSLDGHITSRAKTEARSLCLQTYIHNRRLRLRQRSLLTEDQHSDDGSEQESSEMDDIVFAVDQAQFQRNLWEVEQRMQERTQSAAKSRSQFLMERSISAGEKVDHAQLVVQRQRTVLEKRQLKVRHDLEQKMMQAMERRNAYLEAAIENDPSRRFRRKSQTNKDHETKKANTGSDSKIAPTSRAVARVTPGTTSALIKRSPTLPSGPSSSSTGSATFASVATRLPPHNSSRNSKNMALNHSAKNSDGDMTNSSKTTTAHLTHLITNPTMKRTSPAMNYNVDIVTTDSNRNNKDQTEGGGSPMDVDGGRDRLEEMAIWAQRRIRERLMVKAAQEYMQAIGSHDRVLALDFDPLARLLHTNRTLIKATLKLLKYSSQQVRMHHPDQPKRVYKAPARVFLSMYMVLAHPDQIRSPSEADEASFQSLVTSAKVLLESLERWVAAMTFTENGGNSTPIATFGHNLLSDDQHRAVVVHQFDRAWASYYSMFEAWKARDAQRLLHTLLNHAQHIEALWVTVNSDLTARLEWQPRIEEQRRDLREKAGQLAGADGVAQLDAVFSDFMAATRPPITHPPHHIMGPPRPGSFALPSSPPMGSTFAMPRSPPTLRPIMPAPPSSPAYPLTRLPLAPSPITPSIESASDATISAASSPHAHEVDVTMEEPPSEVAAPTPEALGSKRPRKKSTIAREAAEALESMAGSKGKGPRQRKKKATINTEENTETDILNEAEATPKVIKKPRAKKTLKADDNVDQAETDPKTGPDTEEAPKVVKKSRAKKTSNADDTQDRTDEAPKADNTPDQTEEAPKAKKPRATKTPKIFESPDSQETVSKVDGEPGPSEETPKPVKKPRAKKSPKTVENLDQGETVPMATDGELEEAPKVKQSQAKAKKAPKTDNPDEETVTIAVDGELGQEIEAPKVKKPRAKKAPKTVDLNQETALMAVDGEPIQEEEATKGARKPQTKKVPKTDDTDQESVPMAVGGEPVHEVGALKAVRKPQTKKAPKTGEPDEEVVPIADDGETVQDAPKVVKKPRAKKAPKIDDPDQETVPVAADGELDQEEPPQAVRKPRIRRAPKRADDEEDQATVPEDADKPDGDVKDASEKVGHTNWRGGPKYEKYDKISPINFQNIEDKDSTDPVPGFEKPADWTKVKLIHELALDPNFKIESNRASESSSDENSFEARIRAVATKAYFDSIREDAAQGQLGKWIPSILTRIREQLLEMVPPNSAIAMQMNEAFDLEFVQQQVDRNVFDVHGAIKTVLEMMSKLCAPVRDARLQKIQVNLSQVSYSPAPVSEPLRFSSESGNDLVSVLQDVLELLDDMLMDLANFRLMAARPSLEKQAIPYEQKAFKQALKNKEITMDNVRVWLQRAADAEIESSASASSSTSGSGSVQSPSSPASSVAPATWTAAFTPTKMLFNRHFAVFARAMFNLLFSAELIDMQENFPETFNLDRDRLVRYQNEIQALVLTAVLIQIGQTNAPPLQEAEQVELKDNLLALMEKPDTSIETLANCVIEAKENAILTRQSSSGSGCGPLLTSIQKGTLRNLINSAVEIESPMFKVIWKRMRAVLESYTVAPRYTIAMPGKEELTKVGLNALTSEIDKLADSIRFLAKYNANVYHEWYDPMLKEMLPAHPVVHQEREKK